MHILKHSFCFLSFFDSFLFFFDYEFQEFFNKFCSFKGFSHGFRLNGKLWLESKYFSGEHFNIHLILLELCHKK